MDFNAMMERLEQIVKLLEGGETTLEQSIDLYKEATELADKCNQRLKKAELSIVQLTEAEGEKDE